MRIRRGIDLYCTLFWAGLKAKLNYRADLLVMVTASILSQGIGYLFLWVVFQQLPVVAGWTLPEVICVYAMIFITEGFISIFAEGLWGLSWVKHRGDFDAIVLRPVSPLLQVLLGSVGLNGFGAILLGGTMMGYAAQKLSIAWTPAHILVATGLFFSAVLMRFATVLISAAAGFWMESPFNPVLPVIHSVSSFARFPLTIYGRVLNLVLTFVIPFGFVSYYPVAWVLGKEPLSWIGLFTPAVALLFTLVGALLFQRGLKEYEGAGN